MNKGTPNNDYISFPKVQNPEIISDDLTSVPPRSLEWKLRRLPPSLAPSASALSASVKSALDCSLRSVAGGSATDSCAGVCTKWQFGPEDFGWLRLTSWIRALSPHHSAPARRWTVCTAIWRLGGPEKEKKRKKDAAGREKSVSEIPPALVGAKEARVNHRFYPNQSSCSRRIAPRWGENRHRYWRQIYTSIQTLYASIVTRKGTHRLSWRPVVRVKIHSICPNAHFQIFIRPDPDSSGASSLGFIPQKQKTAYGRWGSAEFSAFFEGSCESGSVVINLINLGRSASLKALCPFWHH